MRAAGCSSLVVAMLLLPGCKDNSRAADPATSECQRVEIGGKPYALRVPKGSLVTTDAASGSVAVRPNPNGRLVRSFTVQPRGGMKLPSPRRSEVLANGARVSYAIDDQIGGGSGGPEGELAGELNLVDGATLVATCRDQNELGPRPDWCLRHLGTIEPAGSARACS